MVEYDFEVDRILQEINDLGAIFVGLQFPEGLKKYATELAKKIEHNSDAEVVIFTDPVYGACDTKDRDIGLLELDLVIHFGHTDLI